MKHQDIKIGMKVDYYPLPDSPIVYRRCTVTQEPWIERYLYWVCTIDKVKGAYVLCDKLEKSIFN